MPSILELTAMLFTVACVYFAVRRNIWTYPVGMIGTTLYLFLFLSVSLPLATLQLVFNLDQLYGWWFWLYGDKGNVPPIRRSGLVKAMAWGAMAAFGGYLIGQYMSHYPKALMGPLDTSIAAASLVAQLFLDRKRIENWALWLIVNTVSVYYYWTVALFPTAILYVILWFNAFYGHREWTRELRGYEGAQANAAFIEQQA